MQVELGLEEDREIGVWGSGRLGRSEVRGGGSERGWGLTLNEGPEGVREKVEAKRWTPRHGFFVVTYSTTLFSQSQRGHIPLLPPKPIFSERTPSKAFIRHSRGQGIERGGVRYPLRSALSASIPRARACVRVGIGPGRRGGVGRGLQGCRGEKARTWSLQRSAQLLCRFGGAASGAGGAEPGFEECCAPARAIFRACLPLCELILSCACGGLPRVKMMV